MKWRESIRSAKCRVVSKLRNHEDGEPETISVDHRKKRTFSASLGSLYSACSDDTSNAIGITRFIRKIGDSSRFSSGPNRGSCVRRSKKNIGDVIRRGRERGDDLEIHKEGTRHGGDQDDSASVTNKDEESDDDDGGFINGGYVGDSGDELGSRSYCGDISNTYGASSCDENSVSSRPSVSAADQSVSCSKSTGHASDAKDVEKSVFVVDDGDAPPKRMVLVEFCTVSERNFENRHHYKPW